MTLPRLLRTTVLAGAAALTLALSACDAGDYTTARDAAPVGTSSSGGTVAPTGGLGTGVTSVGTVVTSDGFTVYRFANDKTAPSTSTCTGACEVKWPPVHGDGQPALQGIPSGLVGTVGRPDGTQQLTLNGWPLYRFAGDAKPGEAKGEGVGGTWAAMGANGSPASAGPSASPATAPDAVPAGSGAAVHNGTAGHGTGAVAEGR
jgi:predicted lipoprotein with Yx(FWY)xxD motif